MLRTLVLAAAVMLAAVPLRADEKPALAEGNWMLKVLRAAGTEYNYAILKVEMKDGKPVATLLSAAPLFGSDQELDSFTVDGDKVTAVVHMGGTTKATFEGTLNPKSEKEILGSDSEDRGVFRARLVATDKESIGRNEILSRIEVPETMQKAQQLQLRPVMIRGQILREADPEKKAQLQKDLEAATEEVKKELPGLYKEVMSKNADDPSAIDAATALLKSASLIKASAEDVTAWAKTMESLAERYGKRYLADARTQIAESLAGNKDYANISLGYAEKAAAGNDPAAPLNQQVRLLKVLKTAQEAAGKTDAAKVTTAALAKIEEGLDAEYLKKVPPFTPEKYSGRADGGSQVVVMELFTGAECPPCVAADAAFDGLMKAYDPKELVLIQYHMHIPGPDPLTNEDCVARWNYYRKLFPQDMRGVPSSLFNGTPKEGGGGAMANSEAKFKKYTSVINPTLDKSTAVKVTGSANRKDDTLNIDVAVEGIKEPTDDLKLRLVLVEESIRYTGGNGIRFHHQVVRALPGGAEGVALKDLKDGKHTAKVDLAELKTKLAKYVENYNANVGAFPNADRPLALEHLRAIALVQDDKTGEIVQAAQFEVGGAK